MHVRVCIGCDFACVCVCVCVRVHVRRAAHVSVCLCAFIIWMFRVPTVGTADAEIELLSAGSPEHQSFSFESGVGQNVALLASPADRNFAFTFFKNS